MFYIIAQTFLVSLFEQAHVRFAPNQTMFRHTITTKDLCRFANETPKNLTALVVSVSIKKLTIEAVMFSTTYANFSNTASNLPWASTAWFDHKTMQV